MAVTRQNLSGGVFRFGEFYIGTDSHVHNLDTGTDLTVVSGAPAVMAGTPVTALQKNSYQRVYYISVGAHLMELAEGDSNQWSSTDLTLLTGAWPATSTKLTSIGLPGNNGDTSIYPRVYFVGTNNHVQELAWASGWHLTDISAAAGAFTPATGSPLASLVYSNADPILPSTSNFPRVYFVDVNGYVNELAYQGGWHAANISSVGGTAAVAGIASPLAATNIGAQNGGGLRVYYANAAGHLYQLTWEWGGGYWTVADLTSQTSTPALATNGGQMAVDNGEYHQFNIFYTTSDSHLRQLKWWGGWYQYDLGTVN